VLHDQHDLRCEWEHAHAHHHRQCELADRTYTYNANGSVLTMDGPRMDIARCDELHMLTRTTRLPGSLGCRGQIETITNAWGVTSITDTRPASHSTIVDLMG
jgi:hypothetical protein